MKTLKTFNFQNSSPYRWRVVSFYNITHNSSIKINCIERHQDFYNTTRSVK